VHGQRRPLDDVAGEVPRPTEQLVLREDLVDDAPLQRLRGRDGLAGEQEVARPDRPQQHRPDDVLAVAGDHAAPEVRAVLEGGGL
jgi:hypothetical protein